MSDKPFEHAAGIVARSGLVRAAGRMLQLTREAAPRSAAYGVARRLCDSIAQAPAVERVRLVGVAILTAVATQAMLLRWVPSVVRPYAPGVGVAMAAAALVLIVMARPIVRGWPRSRTRRVCARLRQTSMHA